MNSIDETYIKVVRKIMSWRWYKDGNTFRVFVHLLLKANFENHDFENITVERGQVVTSVNHIAEELHLSHKNVRTALEHLKKTNEVAIETTSKYTIVTILNYNLYQSDRQSKRQTTGKQTANDRQQYKNNKNVKNENIYILSENAMEKIINHLNEKTGSHYRTNTPTTVRLINSRLKEGFTEEDFIQVIDIMSDKWLKDSKMRDFLRPETLFGTKFESYLNSGTKTKPKEKNYQDITKLCGGLL